MGDNQSQDSVLGRVKMAEGGGFSVGENAQVTQKRKVRQNFWLGESGLESRLTPAKTKKYTQEWNIGSL